MIPTVENCAFHRLKKRNFQPSAVYLPAAVVNRLANSTMNKGNKNPEPALFGIFRDQDCFTLFGSACFGKTTGLLGDNRMNFLRAFFSCRCRSAAMALRS
jgi:hypothetical protein